MLRIKQKELETRIGVYKMNKETERCVVCKCDTEVPVETHVEKRNNYVYGVGQTCSTCYNKLYYIEEKEEYV